MTIPFYRPSIGAEEKAGVQRVLDSGWLTTGKVAREFEERFAEYVGARYAVAVNSCTAALHLGLEAYGVREGDAVLVPTMTFAATAEVVRYFGARPVLVDCDPQTLVVDPDAMEAAAAEWAPSGKLKAMIPMHYGGQMCDMDRMAEISKRYRVPMMEDAAHTLPAYYRSHSTAPWRSVGETSPMACFSFYANKCITTGEGGMLTTSDESIADRVRMMSLHGLSKNAWTRFESKGSWYYEIVEAGFKYNLTDVAAAIGLAQLGKANDLWRERQALAATYRDLLSGSEELFILHPELSDRQSSWHLFPIQLNLDALSIDRAQFIEEMKAAGVTCSVHWMPLHLHPYYVREYGYRPEDFPQASSVWPRLVSLPLFPGMSRDEVQYVANTTMSIATRHARQTVSV